MSKSESKKTTDSKKRRDPSTEKEIQSGTPLSSTGHNFYELLTLLIKKIAFKVFIWNKMGHATSALMGIQSS